MILNRNRHAIIMAISLLLYSAFLASQALAAKLTVELPSEQVVLEYSQPIRLDQLLRDVIKQSKVSSPLIFSVGNQLFNIDRQNEALQLKQQIISHLQRIAAQDADLRVSSEILIEQINSWDIGYRELINLDYNQVRIEPEDNPLLSGNYELILPNRENRVRIEGLLFDSRIVDFTASDPLSAYIIPSSILSSANPSYAWIIYPDGPYKRVGYAYWNDEGTRLTPGSVIFIGFNSDSEEFQTLEANIIKLISMRKGL